MKKKTLLIAVLLLCLTGTTVQAQKIDQRLTRLVKQSSQRRARGKAPLDGKAVNKTIAVEFNADGTIAWFSAIATLKEGAECPTERLEQMGIQVRYVIGDMVALRIPADKLQALEDVEEFRYVSADEKKYPANDKAREASKVDKVDKPEAATQNGLPKAYTGEGVVLGVIDRCIDFNHAAFRNADGSTRIKKVIILTGETTKKEYNTEEEIKALTCDNEMDSHGTHTAAIAGGSAIGNGYQGMAPQADLVLCGLGNYSESSNIAECIQAVFDYAASVNKPAVVNLSYGSDIGLHDGSDVVCKTIASLTENGTKPGRAVLISSGNDAANFQSIVATLKKANADDLGYELKTLLGATNPDTGRKDLPVMYNGAYCVYASDYQTFDLSYSLVDIKTGQLILGGNHIKVIDNNNQVKDWNPADMIFHNDQPTLQGGNASVCTINFRSTPIYLDNEDYRLCLFVKGSKDGQVIKMMCDDQPASEPCFAAPAVPNGYNFLDAGYTYGNSEFAFSVETCSDAVISVGAYTTRNQWTDYTGEGREYEKSKITDKKQEIGEIIDFSSYGIDDNGKARPTIIAPGGGLISAVSNWDRSRFYAGQPAVPNPENQRYIKDLIRKEDKFGRANWYMVAHGTSMSCPAAAGVVTLWMQAKPTLTVNEINALLKETSVNDEWTTNIANIPSGNKVQAGYGKIDCLAGLKKILGTTAIETVEADGHREATPATMYSVDAPVYNLNGQRVDKNHKGLVIYKGRVYINK